VTSPRAADCHHGGGGDPEYRVEPAVLVLSDDLSALAMRPWWRWGWSWWRGWPMTAAHIVAAQATARGLAASAARAGAQEVDLPS